MFSHFAFPPPPSRQNYKNISLEFYYSDEEIKTEKNGKRLCFTNEVAITIPGSNRQKKILQKYESSDIDDELAKKIYDENIGSENWIHSKSVFADLVSGNSEFSQEFGFENFRLIFDKIESIINPKI